MTGTGRTTSTPGVSAGTMICDARACGGASGSVTAITIPNAAPSAPDENHLCPSITHSSPSRTARVRSVRRVGARHLRLGHREERPDLAGDERDEPALLLLVACRTCWRISRVAGVGRLAAEDELRVRRAADLLVQVRVGEEALRRCRRPPAAGAAPRGPASFASRSWPASAISSVVLARERRLVRVDVLLHEGAVARAQLVQLVGGARSMIVTPVSIARGAPRLLHGLRAAGHEPARADRARAGGGAPRLRLGVGGGGVGDGRGHACSRGSRATTERIKLGSAIMQIPGRTPANTAMTAATLDLLSGGRFLLGLGTSGPQVVEGWHGAAVGQAAREDARVRRDRAHGPAPRACSSTTASTTTSRTRARRDRASASR